jgi:hypothetical protein
MNHRANLHDRAVDLWRTSLERDLLDVERRQYNAIEAALNPGMPDRFAEKYLGRGTYYATNADWDAQLAQFKARKKRAA